MDLNTLILVSHASVLAVVMALVSLSKQYIVTRWAPLISVFLGIVGEVTFFSSSLGVANAVFAGVVIGLIGCGLYSGTKTTLTPTLE